MATEGHPRAGGGESGAALQFAEGDWRVLSFLDEARSRDLFVAVHQGRIEREQVFRDNWRTLSAQVRFQDLQLLLKIPRARNGRLWERVLTVFRGSDARRIFHQLSLMRASGLLAPEPVMVGEKHKAGLITDAFVCYRYVDARRAGPGDAGRILDSLRKLHRLGYLRTDAQLANFLIQDGEVVFIDFRLKRPWLLPRLQKARELDRFVRSCPPAKSFMTPAERGGFWFRVAHLLEEASFARREIKRRLRGRKRKKRPGHGGRQ